MIDKSLPYLKYTNPVKRRSIAFQFHWNHWVWRIDDWGYDNAMPLDWHWGFLQIEFMRWDNFTDEELAERGALFDSFCNKIPKEHRDAFDKSS